MTENTLVEGTDAVSTRDVLELTTEIVAAYVGRNPLQSADLPELIHDVYKRLSTLGASEGATERKEPAVPVKASLTDEYIICLEDGLKFKSLKRHLRSKYDITPEQYREKWGLPYDYPMVAPSYARKRSKLAREMGLGRGSK